MSARPEVNIRVVPRAGRTGIAGVRGGALLVRLAAPPVDGAANEALLRLLAGVLDCPRRHLDIVAGLRSRQKRVAISGMTVEEIGAKLARITSNSELRSSNFKVQS
jgi:uncharacterized protein (TIGR00251 family)